MKRKRGKCTDRQEEEVERKVRRAGNRKDYKYETAIRISTWLEVKRTTRLYNRDKGKELVMNMLARQRLQRSYHLRVLHDRDIVATVEIELPGGHDERGRVDGRCVETCVGGRLVAHLGRLDDLLHGLVHQVAFVQQVFGEGDRVDAQQQSHDRQHDHTPRRQNRTAQRTLRTTKIDTASHGCSKGKEQDTHTTVL